MSLAEPFVKPSTMLYRNFLAMESEELLRSHPIDGAVLMGGCDKTTPGLVMGAISMGLPAIYRAGRADAARQLARPARSAPARDAWKYWDEKRAGKIGEEDWGGIEGGIARSSGTCMTMGTAATMTAIAEALGMALPGASSIPAADANHPRMAAATGRRIVEMVWEDLTPGRNPHAGRLRQRHPRAHGDGRLDQRHHPSGRAWRAAPASRSTWSASTRSRAQVPVLANIAPVGQISDGGFLLCRRLARADGAAAATCSTSPASR